MLKKVVIGILVLAFQATAVGSVCATPKTHPCCKKGIACTTVLTCCTPSPVKGAAPQAGIQQNFSNVVVAASAVPETPAVLSIVILDRVLSVHSPPLFLSKSSLLL